ALTQDLERFLAGEPVHARPAAAWERAVKWARRHPARAGVGGVVVLAVATVLVVVLAANAGLQRESARAEASRQEAVANLQTALAAVDRMLTRVGEDRLPDVPQVELVRTQLLEDALEFYQGLALRAGDDPKLLEETARAYRRLGGFYHAL